MKKITWAVGLLVLILFVLFFGDQLLERLQFSNQVANQDSRVQAEEVLTTFFRFLNEGNYNEAVKYFEVGGPDLDNGWEDFSIFSPPEDRGDKAKMLANYCRAVTTCDLRLVIKDLEEIVSGEFEFTVNFLDSEGEVFVLGPCCGATEEEMPPTKTFKFLVKEVDGEFKVKTPPVYIP